MVMSVVGRRAGRRYRAAWILDAAGHLAGHRDPGDRCRDGSGVGGPLRELQRVRGERRERRRVRAVARPAGRSPHSCVPDWPSTRSPRGAWAHLPLLDRDGQRAAGIRRSTRSVEAVASSPRRFRAGIATGRRRLRPSHAGAVDARLDDLARRRARRLPRPRRSSSFRRRSSTRVRRSGRCAIG